METNITIEGRVPSKKNSKWTKVINGRPIQLSSKKFQDWNEEKRWELRAQNRQKCIEIEAIVLTFYAPDQRKADLTNKAESIMDLLVDEQIIGDDNWFEVPDLRLKFGGVEKENPRVDIHITHGKETTRLA